MNNLWNRSVGPFDEAAVQRHRHMGLLDCNGDVNADAVNFLAHLCAGLFFDALCDSYVEMQTVSRICILTVFRGWSDRTAWTSDAKRSR